MASCICLKNYNLSILIILCFFLLQHFHSYTLNDFFLLVLVLDEQCFHVILNEEREVTRSSSCKK